MSELQIDECDRWMIERWKWVPRKSLGGYFCRGSKTFRRNGDRRGKTQLLHRFIAAAMLCRELESGEQVDHINRDRHDNRRCNLRVGTQMQNLMNKTVYKNNRTGFKGVGIDLSGGNKKPYTARVRLFGKLHHCGRFNTPEEAFAAASKKRMELGFSESETDIRT